MASHTKVTRRRRRNKRKKRGKDRRREHRKNPPTTLSLDEAPSGAELREKGEGSEPVEG
ncbi:MAG: hypothetical protein ACE5H5_06740 [Nitrospinota bacterium]